MAKRKKTTKKVRAKKVGVKRLKKTTAGSTNKTYNLAKTKRTRTYKRGTDTYIIDNVNPYSPDKFRQLR